jgi:hypothetical protein
VLKSSCAMRLEVRTLAATMLVVLMATSSAFARKASLISLHCRGRTSQWVLSFAVYHLQALVKRLHTQYFGDCEANSSTSA